MSPRTATKQSTPAVDENEAPTEMLCAEDLPARAESDASVFAAELVDDGGSNSESPRPAIDNAEDSAASSYDQVATAAEVEAQANVADPACEPHVHPDVAQTESSATRESAADVRTDVLSATQGDDHQMDQSDQSTGASAVATEHTPEASDAPETPAASLPDPTNISARLRNLVVAVGQVEELSRRAREAAASDLALYNGIAASQRQFEDGLAEAQRIGQEAEGVYKRAFGRDARAVAEPAVTEAREVELAFAELANAWRQQAESFLAEHPDVESLLAEQRQDDEEARRRAIARTKAERFQQLVNGTDAALRQGLTDEARDCLKMLATEFPAEADRVKPLHDRLQQRVRAANDAAARRVLVQASELQGRGEFNAAVRLLEAVDVQGLSREASEDVFGRWSAACSLLAQTGDLELLRWSPAQGRGVILHQDPSVPYGLVEFSALGMGPSHFEGRVVSAGDREGALIVSRARPFRAAELPADLSTVWYGRSYVTSGVTAAVPVRH